MSTREIVEVATDFFEKIPEERVAKLVKEDIAATLQKKEEEKKKEEEIKQDKKKLKPSKSKGAGGMQGGGGDPRARVTQKGVLGIISGQIKGKSVASADIFGKGGFASDIDAVLSGVGGLKAGGSGGVGRKGAAGIGYGAGYGSGFGGSGAGGIDDLIGGLMGGDGGGGLDLKKRGSLKVSAPEFTKGGALTGGRSKASIMRVVMQNLAALRYEYNKRLREKPGLKGKITVKFAIDEFGTVIFAQVVESTISDSQLETQVVSKIKRWKFEKIDKPGDVTEIIYPFVFSQ
ncbi:MAG: TonB family protein [Fibrobacter sp.]|nr:TonB family protein [Fibrobacter sp.]